MPCAVGMASGESSLQFTTLVLFFIILLAYDFLLTFAVVIDLKPLMLMTCSLCWRVDTPRSFNEHDSQTYLPLFGFFSDPRLQSIQKHHVLQHMPHCWVLLMNMVCRRARISDSFLIPGSNQHRSLTCFNACLVEPS